MKILHCITIWLLLLATGFCADDYQARYDELKPGGNANSKKIVALLAEWREKQPDDPQALITSANYYLELASEVNISTKPAGKGDAVVADPKTGKPVGSISSATDGKLVAQAIGFLVTANGRFPDRLDIWVGLAYMYHKNGDFDALFKTLQGMAAYAKDHGDSLKWLKGGKPPEPAEQFVPRQIHDHASDYYEDGTQEGLERCMKIAQIAVDNYPRHDYAYNDIAACYSAKKNDAKVREWLEKASAIDPNDTLVLLNLGDACARLKDNAAARKYYQRVIDLKKSTDDVDAAKEALAGLKD